MSNGDKMKEEVTCQKPESRKVEHTQAARRAAGPCATLAVL